MLNQHIETNIIEIILTVANKSQPRSKNLPPVISSGFWVFDKIITMSFWNFISNLYHGDRINAPPTFTLLTNIINEITTHVILI